MPAKQHWEGVYSSKAPTSVSWFQEHPEISLRLIRASGARADSAIIDVGGGAGRLVDDLLAEGFRQVTVLDIAGAALAAAQVRLGARASAVQWIEADITRVSLPAAAFDVWHDRAAFHFLTEAADRNAYLALMHRAVKTGGYAILATFAEDGPERCSGLPVVRYSTEQLQVLLGNNWTLLQRERETHHTPFGTVQQFQFGCFRRQGA